MAEGIGIPLLEQFAEFLANHIGLHFPPERWPDLQRGIRAAAKEFDYEREEACVRWLMSAPLTTAQIEVLAGNLTVGETYFFRERRAFEALELQVLPALIHARRDGERRLRCWSAGCCTGEEAYSLAIVLRRLLPDLRHWNVTILATDLNPRFLHKAERGVFGEWSFRDAPPWLRDCYFTSAGAKQYEILPEIRRMVAFEHLNLAQDIYPALLNDTNAMDVILCRNVLMYFAPQQAKKVVEKLRRCLVGGGWLIVSATETSADIAAGLVPVHMDGTTFYRQGEREVEPAPEAVAPPEAKPAPLAETAAPPDREPAAPAQPLIHLARDLANEGRLTEALACADNAVAAEKLNPRAHYLRAMILQEQGALHDAARELQRAIYLDHDFVLAHFALGNLARSAGRAKEADRHFENALRRLRAHSQDDILPESDGLSAGRLVEIITASMAEESVA
jgi:chemotaxis protein methyltransferase CheR